MYWKLTCPATPQDRAATHPSGGPDGRFVLHRHRDDQGPHLDLRLECGDCLLGWRIDAVGLDGDPWAVEKPPHPLHWLDGDGDAIREDAGVYTWLERGTDRRRLLLDGRGGPRTLLFERVPALSPRCARAVCEALAEVGAAAVDGGRLIRDGAAARRHAVARFCGLGRELDGSAFDEKVWRKALDTLSLDEIHDQLRAYEVRFDLRYPPEPVSRPERLPDDARDERMDVAMTILRDARA